MLPSNTLFATRVSNGGSTTTSGQMGKHSKCENPSYGFATTCVKSILTPGLGHLMTLRTRVTGDLSKEAWP
jgi:hypothetical protein